MKHTEQRYWIGRKVTLSARLVRVNDYGWIGKDAGKAWAYYPRSVTGWIVGFRSLQNGVSVWNGPDEPTGWKCTSRVAAVLIAEEPWKNPIPCPVECLQEIAK